jgi:hypothetical protein
MREYDVEIRETLSKTIKVTADSPVFAKYIAERQYNDSVHVLDESHFKGVTFNVHDNRNYER